MVRGLSTEFRRKQIRRIVLWSDNQRAIHLSRNSKYHLRTKHIDVSNHFIREQIDRRLMELKYLHTGEMPADGDRPSWARQIC